MRKNRLNIGEKTNHNQNTIKIKRKKLNRHFS